MSECSAGWQPIDRDSLPESSAFVELRVGDCDPYENLWGGDAVQRYFALYGASPDVFWRLPSSDTSK